MFSQQQRNPVIYMAVVGSGSAIFCYLLRTTISRLTTSAAVSDNTTYHADDHARSTRTHTPHRIIVPNRNNY